MCTLLGGGVYELSKELPFVERELLARNFFSVCGLESVHLLGRDEGSLPIACD